MNFKPVFTVALPYLAAAALVAGVATGVVSPELAAMLAVALGLPSPLAHAAGAMGAALKPKPDADKGDPEKGDDK